VIHDKLTQELIDCMPRGKELLVCEYVSPFYSDSIGKQKSTYTSPFDHPEAAQPNDTDSHKLWETCCAVSAIPWTFPNSSLFETGSGKKLL
jgi:hypothetical protein